MQDQLILALSGVALGWLLSAISNYFKNRSEKKKALGKLIQKLYWIHIQLVSWNQQMNVFKDHLADFRKFEERRKQMHSIEIFDTIGLDSSTISEIAEMNPFYAIKIKNRLEEFKSHHIGIEKVFEISDLTNNPYTYYSYYWSISASSFIFQKEIESVISKFSFSYGMLIWFRLKLTIKYSQSKEKNIRSYVWNYLKTIEDKKDAIPTDSEMLEALVSRMPISEDEKVEFLKNINEYNSKRTVG